MKGRAYYSCVSWWPLISRSFRGRHTWGEIPTLTHLHDERHREILASGDPESVRRSHAHDLLHVRQSTRQRFRKVLRDFANLEFGARRKNVAEYRAVTLFRF